MKGDPVPDGDHVLRHCGPRFLERDHAGVPIGVTKDAFDDESGGASVTWVEYFAQSPNPDRAAIDAICATGRVVRNSHRFGKFNVGRIKAAGREAGVSLAVEHDPNVNPGHSLIKGILPNAHAELMARMALDLVALLDR